MRRKYAAVSAALVLAALSFVPRPGWGAEVVRAEVGVAGMF